MKNYKYMVVVARKGFQENSSYNYNAWLYTDIQLKHQCALWAEDSLAEKKSHGDDQNVSTMFQFGDEYESYEDLYNTIVSEVNSDGITAFDVERKDGELFITIKSIEAADSRCSEHEPSDGENWPGVIYAS